MSTRAYKIIAIETEKSPTFNFAFSNIVDLACNKYTSDNSGEAYMLEFYKDTVEVEISELTERIEELESSATEVVRADMLDELEAWKRVLADFPEGEDYVMYECY